LRNIISVENAIKTIDAKSLHRNIYNSDFI